MRWILAALSSLLLCVCAVAAQASGYDNLADGIAANQRGDSDRAIGAFSAALAASDLSPALRPTALYGRGQAYLRKGLCSLALADADAAIEAKKEDGTGHWLRAEANVCLGKLEAALSDYSAVIALAPAGGIYRTRGRLRWRMGDSDGAVADLREALRLSPKNPYTLLWLAVVETRAGKLDAAFLKDAGSQLSTHSWPYAVLALFEGKARPADIDDAAREGSEYLLTCRQCEADFYVAEWQLAGGDVASARQRLERAVASCPGDFDELTGAKFELDRLGK